MTDMTEAVEAVKVLALIPRIDGRKARRVSRCWTDPSHPSPNMAIGEGGIAGQRLIGSWTGCSLALDMVDQGLDLNVWI